MCRDNSRRGRHHHHSLYGVSHAGHPHHRLHKLFSSWTRLLDGSNGNKVHPAREGSSTSGPGPPSVIISAPLMMRSSVDLAPSLMNLYDSYTTGTKGDSRLTSSELHLSDLQKPAAAAAGCEGQRLQGLQGRHGGNQGASHSELCNNNLPSIEINHSYAPDNSTDMKEVTTTRVVNPSTGNCGGGSGSRGGSSHQGHGSRGGVGSSEAVDQPVSPLHHTDAKKRPLSVSSTASSSSSTSSLPRQQRKKVATNLVTTSSLASPSLAGVGGGSGGSGADSFPGSGLYGCSGRTLTSPSAAAAAAGAAHDNGYGQQMELGGEEEDFHIMDQVPEEVEVDLQHLAESDTSGCRSPPQSPLSKFGLEHGGAYIDRVVAEILATERTYVKDLSDIIQGYLGYINSSPELGMCADDIAALFGNIEAIFEFNRDFLQHLEQCDSDPVKLAQCFVSKNGGFVIYTDYCTNYPRAVEVLTQCMRQTETAEGFKLQQRSLNHGLPLGSYLLKPVQRILKYHLLLQAILNNYDKSKDGHNIIEMALESMTSMAQHINEMKRKHEHAVRIQEIQSTLYGWEGADLTTFGDLVLENTFRIQGAKAFRQIFLFEKALLIAKKREDGNFVCKGTIMCSNLMLVESIPKEPLSFHVIPFDNPRMQYTVQAKNLDQKRTWCQEVKRLMLENYNAVIPDKAKELVMKLGKSREEEDFDNSNVESVEPSRKQHSAPEYLERRRGRRRSTSIIPDFGLLKTQKARKGSRKSESPKSSPKLRRKSDITHPFSPLILKGDSDNDDIKEEELSETEREEEAEVKPTKHVRSLSLESIHDLLTGSELKATNIDITSDSKEASRPVSFDDSCSRANKISHMLASEGLAAQLSHKQDSDIDWDENIVSSVLSVSSVKRAESFKRATELNRVDSVSVSKARRARLQQQSSTLSAQSVEGDASSVDGRSRLSATCESPTASLMGNSPRPVRNPFHSAEVIANHHAKSTDSLDRVVVKSTSDNEGDETGHYDNVPVSDYDNVILSPSDARTSSPRVSRPSSAAGSWQTAYSPVGSPILSGSSKPSGDPWVPQTPDNEPRRRAKLIARQHSMGSADLLSRDVRKAALLKRSNSLSSLSESKEDLADIAEPVRSKGGHLRMPSDTLIFANRTVFLASPTQRTVRHDPSVQRAITRLATPPRELGPVEMLKQIEASRDNGRTVTRFATPPRTFAPEEDSQTQNKVNTSTVLVNNYSCDLEKEIFETLKSVASGVSQSCSSTPTHAANRTALGMCRSPVLTNRPATMDFSSPIHSSLWQGFEEYLRHSESQARMLPQFPVPEIQIHHLAPRPDSFCVPSSVMTRGQSHQRCASSPQSPIMSSPSASSTTSHDGGVVDSLKNAFMNFTSKLTGRSPRSVETSPSRSSPRTRSTSALDQLGVSHECQKSPRHREKSEKAKDKRKFVYQLARVYNDRLKPRNRPGSEKRRREKEMAMTKELTSLLKGSKQGGSTIGERMAQNKPIILGTYTLQRHRPARPRKSRESGEGSDHSGQSSREMTPETQVTFDVPSELIKSRQSSTTAGGAKASSSNHDSGCLEDDVFKTVEDQNTASGKPCDDTQTRLEHSGDTSQPEAALALPSAAFNKILIPQDPADNSGSEQEDMYECYYEKKFAEDLENSLADEAFRDSAVYSDDGGTQEAEPQSSTKVTIRETVKLIEQRSRTRPVQKIQVKHAEKAQGMQHIVKSLESQTTSPLASPDPGRRVCETTTTPPDRSTKSIRERTRELEECAALTRIRQNSCSLNEDYRVGAVAEPEDLRPISPASKGDLILLPGDQFLSSDTSA